MPDSPHRANEPLLPSVAGPEGPVRVFRVRFLDRDRFRGNQRHALALGGEGEVRVGTRELVLALRRRRWFLPARQSLHSWPIARVHDVSVQDKYVRFQVEATDIDAPGICVALADAPAAQELARALPASQSPENLRREAEFATYAQWLGDLSARCTVVPAIIVLNAAVFLLMALAGAGLSAPSPGLAVSWGANYGPRTFAGQWWRLLSCVFVHAGLLHVAFNMLALYQVGQLAERLLGSARFAAMYLFAGICGSLLSVYLHPATISVGASGAVFGVYGALVALSLRGDTGVPGFIAARYRASSLGFIFYNVVFGLFGAHIDNAAHIGGLVSGALMGFLLARPGVVGPASGAQPRRSWPGLAAAGLLAAAVLGGAGYGLEQAREHRLLEDRFVRMVRHLPYHEQSVLAEFAGLARDLGQGRIDAQRFANALEGQVLPRWDALYRNYEALPLDANSAVLPLRDALLGYLESRRVQCRLLVAGARGSDPDLVAKSTAQAARVVEQLNHVNTVLHATVLPR